jgi:Kef-type K+ transport system membrane component KefB
MNARGLMELIVMKVGLDAGLIGKPLFTMLLVMAIVTTFMTGPLLNLFGQQAKRADQGSVEASQSRDGYRRMLLAEHRRARGRAGPRM